MQIFHIAEKSRWEAAELAGSYAQSTLGRTLEEEGFIHASRADQWEGVRQRYYTEATTELVLLVIDTDKLTSPWSEDQVGDTTYPHIHGPLNPAAVVEVRPIRTVNPEGRASVSFFRLFLGEVVFRMICGLLIMGAVIGGYYALESAGGKSVAPWGLLIGLLVGVAVVFALVRRRNVRLAARA